MAGFFVQMDEQLQEAWQVHRVADLTGRSPQEVIGYLHGFWCWVQRQAKAPGVIPGVGVAALVRVCGGDSLLWESIASVGWLEFRDDGLFVPKWDQRFDRQKQSKNKDAQDKRLAREQARQQAACTTECEEERQEPEHDGGRPVYPPRAKHPSDIGSVFEHLTAEHLGDTGAMIEWIEWAAMQTRPLVQSDERHRIFILAAARFSLTGDNPIAYFKQIVGKQKWGWIKESYINEARACLRNNKTVERIIEARGNALKKSGRNRSRDEQIELLTAKFGIRTA